MRVVILGCGTSGGVPRPDGDWGACDPNEPRNRRTRPSIWVESEGTSILVDSSPDLRAQALAAGIKRIDAVLYTHDHADHTHGIDDLRIFALGAGRPIEAYSDAPTSTSLVQRFSYAFFQDTEALYPAILSNVLIDGPFCVGGIDVTPFSQNHGPVETLGFRFGRVAYSTDLVDLSDEAFEVLAGVEVWIVDALRERPHPTHAHLATTLGWIERLKPARAILTHMTNELDYQALKGRLPAGVEPAYDGLVIAV